MSFTSGLVIGLVIGGTIGLVLAGLFAAAKSDEAQSEINVKLFDDEPKK